MRKSPSHARAALQHLRNGTPFGCGQSGQEVGCFRRPTPFDLACDDHQTGTTAYSGQFRKDPLFATSGLKATPSRAVAPGLGVPS